MGASDPVLQLVCVVLVLGIPASLVMVFPPLRARRLLAVGGAGLVGALASVVVDTALSAPVDGAGSVLDAAMAGAIAATVAVLAATRLGSIGGAVFGAVWSLLVFQPVFAAVVGSVPSLVQTVLGAIDYAGVLATHVAAAASLVALSALPVPPRREIRRPEPSSIARAVAATLFLTLGATAWMVGVERVINGATGRIVANAVVGLLLGAVVWVLSERIAGRPFRPGGLVAGAILGWGAIGAGVAFLSPMALAASAMIGVAGGSAIVVRARIGADLGRRAAIAVIVAVTIGGVVLALLADGFGLAATGSVSQVTGQLGAVVAITLVSAGSGVICWALAALAIVAQERVARVRGKNRWAIPDSN